MGIMLSAKGVTEVSPIKEADLKPFDLAGDDEPPFEGGTAYENVKTSSAERAQQTPPDWFAAVIEFAKAQRSAYDNLVKALANVAPVVASPTPARSHAFPPELLSRPLVNIMVSDTRLGIPPGCVAVLEGAGILSAAMLVEKFHSGELTKIPRIGKAKASVIAETLRAFLAAVESHQTSL